MPSWSCNDSRWFLKSIVVYDNYRILDGDTSLTAIIFFVPEIVTLFPVKLVANNQTLEV